tara:strand:+ start:815 stop:991 length:177 start_codon:yes stop_codon:yes gene_type:complete
MQVKDDKKPKRSDDRKGSTRKNIRFEDELLNQIETDRQSTSETFSEWVKDACNKKLKS